MARIVTFVYLLLMLAVGWRLYAMPWSRGVKLGAGASILLPIPLMLILPALLHPERPFADILRMTGFVLLICGLVCLVGGWSAARVRARRK